MSTDRLFIGADRATLFAAAGGRCTMCGTPLDGSFHADHRTPHSAGGPTELHNGQALCIPCNLTKGGVRGLRPWQREAIGAYLVQQRSDWLVVATPAAGKTRLATETAKLLRAAGVIDHVIVCVPTEHLKVQWAERLAAAGIDIAPDWRNASPAWPTGFDGVAVTYAQVAAGAGADVLQVHVGASPTLVILDEVHHCGDSRAWGDAVLRAFSHATRRISLSGTPFRSDGNVIPFVTYDNGVGVADYHYGYGDGLREGVVRPVWFPRRGGRMEWAAPDGVTWQATFDEELPEAQLNQRLRTAIDAGGDWLSVTLADADDELRRVRTAFPDAGGLVVANDIAHARAIAALLERESGSAVSVAASDDPAASEVIGSFAASMDSWLVSVRMVSEGVDIPRLMVGVWATVVTTELFFRQVVGRFVRVVDQDADEHAAVFIPDDPRLRGWAAAIAARRDHVLESEVEDLLEDPLGKTCEGVDRSRLSAFQPISSEATDNGVVVGGEYVTAEEMSLAARAKAANPRFERIPTPDIALLLRSAGFVASQPAPKAMDADGSEPTPAFRRRQQLRTANKKIASRIAYRHGVDFRDVHVALNSAVQTSSVEEASVAQLERRLIVAQQWLTTGAASAVG